jgi:hypothetical protein
MDLETIRALVEKYSGIKDISERTRKMDVCYARYIYFKISRDYVQDNRRYSGKITLREIAELLNLNHATVLNGISRVENVLSRKSASSLDKRVKSIYNSVIYLIEKLDGEDVNEYTYYRNKYLEVLDENKDLKLRLSEEVNDPTLVSLFNDFPKKHPDGLDRLKALINGLNMTHGKDKATVYSSY